MFVSARSAQVQRREREGRMIAVMTRFVGVRSRMR